MNVEKQDIFADIVTIYFHIGLHDRYEDVHLHEVLDEM